MRPFLAVLILGLALLMGAFVMGVASRSTAGASLPPAITDANRLAPALGVTVALERYNAAERAAMLDAVTASGFGWVRQRFPWDQIEPEPGAFVWQPWDDVVAAVSERNLGLIAVLDGSPAWARKAEDIANPLAPPRQRADLGRFAHAFAERYGQVLRFYQVWNEPNIQPHWGQGLVDAAGYTGLLREAAVQLRAADPDAVILTAALAPNTEPAGLNQSDVAYLDQLYQAGAAPWFDVVSAQPYGFGRPPADPPGAGVLNFRRIELLREAMQRHGDAQTPLWAIAYGWHAPLAGQSAGASPWQSVDETTQAAWAVDAAEWARAHWSWLGGLAWAIWQPPQPAEDPHWGFALVTPEGIERPVLDALRSWAQQSHPLGPGRWPPNSPAVQTQGGWRLTHLAADPPHGAQTGNNRLIIPFDGNGLALRVQRGPYWGYFDITVDGSPASELPIDDEGRAILVLHDPLAGQETVMVASGLADGQHVVEISATGGWEQWPLLEIDIWRGQGVSKTSRLPWALAAAGALTLALGGIGIALARRQPNGLPLLARVDRVLATLQRLPGTARFGLLALVALASALAPNWLQAPAIAVLAALFVAYPETGPALLAFVAPLFLVTVPILGRPVNPAEAVALLATLALLTRLALNWASPRKQPNSSPHNSTPGTIAPISPDKAGGARLQVRPWPLDWPVLALLAVAVASLFTALNFGVAAHEFRTVILTGVLAYGLVRFTPVKDNEQDATLWPVVWGLGLGAAVVAGWGMVQAGTGAQLIAAEGVLRVRGPYGSPNNLALVLDHVLPIFLGVTLLARRRARRLAAGGLSLILLMGLVLTFSRGALFLGLPAALLFLGFAAGGRWRWIALALVVAGLLLLLPLFRAERFSSMFDLQGGTGFVRLQLWRGAWNMILDHPWLGVGMDNFLYAYRTRYVPPTGWQELSLSHPHNILLDFWTRLGVPGVAVGVWLFAAAFWQGWRARAWLSGDRRALLLGLLASLGATLAHGLIDNSVFLVDLMVVFMLSLGLIAQLAHDPKAGSVRPIVTSGGG